MCWVRQQIKAIENMRICGGGIDTKIKNEKEEEPNMLQTNVD